MSKNLYCQASIECELTSLFKKTLGGVELLNYEYKRDFRVRDYECDIQGVVNNATYQRYMEVTRNEWSYEEMSLNYAEMTSGNKFLFVSKMIIEYKFPLRPSDRFWCGGIVRRTSSVKLHAVQDIYKDDGTEILKADLVIVGVSPGGGYGLPQNIIDRIPLTNENESIR
jgi:acyl-CoA thioester hydrolase